MLDSYYSHQTHQRPRSTLAHLLRKRPKVTDDYAPRVSWLLDLADALDAARLNSDQATSLAETARGLAVQMLETVVGSVAGSEVTYAAAASRPRVRNGQSS